MVALFSPATGVIDSHALMLALEGHIRAQGGSVVLNTEVAGLAEAPGGGFEIACLSAGTATRLGVRSKLTRSGEPARDFAIHGVREHAIPRLVALYGIESPGLTSSLAIGAHVARLLA